MRWNCWYRPRGTGPSAIMTSYSGEYLGHVLERAMEIIDGESRAPWVGWRCVHCGDRFSLPGEPDRYDLPLMERVEVEELPTEGAEYAAVTLALCASNQEGELAGDVWRVADDVAWIMGHGTLGLVDELIGKQPAENCAEERAIKYAEGEAVFRNGEVP